MVKLENPSEIWKFFKKKKLIFFNKSGKNEKEKEKRGEKEMKMKERRSG